MGTEVAVTQVVVATATGQGIRGGQVQGRLCKSPWGTGLVLGFEKELKLELSSAQAF